MLRLKTEVWLLGTAMLLVTAARADEDSVTLDVSHSQTARCGQALDLTCRVATGTPAVRQMSWNKKDAGKVLCECNDGIPDMFPDGSLGDFTCGCKPGELTLSFKEVRHANEGQYLCKLYSFDVPEAYEYTRVMLPDCCSVNINNTRKDPVCTFPGPRLHGEVHWSRRGPDGRWASLNATVRPSGVEGRGAISSTWAGLLEPGQYSCSLWDPESQRYLTCQHFVIQGESQGVRSGATLLGTLGTFWKLWGVPLLVTHLCVKL